MQYYLSSYKFGDQIDRLKHMIPANTKIGHINNARDWVGADVARAQRTQKEEMAFLDDIGFAAEPLDLQAYFGKSARLKEKIDALGAIWVSGGNTFVLRMAMRLSGFDTLFDELKNRRDFLYGGYSAGICILSKSLQSIDQVDDPQNFPYLDITEPIYEGLGVFEYAFLSHYDSDHPESEAVGREIQRCIDNKWLFKALRDGEVIIVE